jgi:hypothetical protein
MTANEIEAAIRQCRVTQTLHREELISVLAAWNSGPRPDRARYLFAELLELENKVEQLMALVPEDEDRK